MKKKGVCKQKRWTPEKEVECAISMSEGREGGRQGMVDVRKKKNRTVVKLMLGKPKA